MQHLIGGNFFRDYSRLTTLMAGQHMPLGMCKKTVKESTTSPNMADRASQFSPNQNRCRLLVWDPDSEQEAQFGINSTRQE